MKKKQLFAVLSTVLLGLLLSGCMKPIQLSERVIVQAIGVDYVDGEYHLTLALYSPKAAKEGAGEEKSPLAEGFGATVGEALEDAKLRQGKEVFWGQSKLIVIGKTAALNGLPGVLGFFNDSYEARPNIDVVTTLGSASELLRAETEEAPAVNIRDMLENGRRNGHVPRARLMDLVGALENGGTGACTPMVERSKEPGGAERIGITGLALYQGGRYRGSADLTAARGVLWLRGDIKAANVAVQGESGRLMMTVVNVKTKLVPSFTGGIPQFAVECSFEGHLSGEEAPGGNLAREADAAERAGAEAVRQEIEAALEQTVRQSGCDVLGLGLLLRQREPGWYGQNAANLEALLPEFGFTVAVNTRVTRYGLQG